MTPPVNEIKIPLAVSIPVGSLVLWALVHTIQTRTLEDFVRYSLFIWALIVPAVLVVVLFLALKDGFDRSIWIIVASVFLSSIVLIPALPLYYAVGASLKDAFFWLQRLSLSQTEAIAAASAVTLLGGMSLFYFRLRLRCFYGISEVIVGVYVGGQRVVVENNNQLDIALLFAILTTSVYLVVRGLDNAHQGWTKEPYDPAAKWLVQLVAKVLPSPDVRGP